MGNFITKVTNSELTKDNQLIKKGPLKLDNLNKKEIIEYIQAIKIQRLAINPDLAEGLKQIDLTNSKLVPMSLELYQKIDKDLPRMISARKKFKKEPISFDPLQVLNVPVTFVNTKENYEKLNNLCNVIVNNPGVLELITLDVFKTIIKDPTPSTDMLGLSKKIVRYLSDYLKQRFINSFNEALNDSSNLDFNFGRATYIYKKGDKTEINNYRRIISIPVIVNLFHRVLMLHCDKHLKDNNLINTTIQKAGISGQKNPILQQVVKIKEIIRDVNTSGNKAALMFLDIKDAFGSLDREALFIILTKYGFDQKFVKYMRNYYDGFSFCTTIENKRINNINWSNGLIQGCSLSPLLFVTALNYIITNFDQTYTTSHGYNFKGTPITLCAYMDDLVLVCKDIESLEFCYKRIIELLGLLGMKLNTQKTNIILPGYSAAEKANVKLDDISIVDKFTYLGCVITSDSSVDNIFSEQYNQIHDWLMNLDVKKPNNDSKIADFTEYVLPEIRRRTLKLYDLSVSNKVKLVSLIQRYLTKWGYKADIQIFPSLEKSLSGSETGDVILDKIDIKEIDKSNSNIAPNSELFDITPYTYNGPVNFKYGEEDVIPVEISA